MSKPKKIDTREFLTRVKKLARDRMTEGKVVSLDSIRNVEEKSPKRLLVIEDDETMRVALKRIFEADGFKVLTVADGTHLNQVLDDSPVDLIIMDIGLPWINGFELAELMKEDSDLKDIPLVSVSGRTSHGDMKRAFELGAVDFIKKPFDVEKIRKTVSTLMKLNS